MSSTTKFTDITIADYTDKSIVVQGDTRKYKEDLKKLGGKYNGILKNGPGWIFPKSNVEELRSFINGGKRLVSEAEAIQGEELSKQRAKEWYEKESKTSGQPSSQPSTQTSNHPSRILTKQVPTSQAIESVSNSTPTLGEYTLLVNLIKGMSNKIDLLEQSMLILMTDEQKEKLKVLMKPKPEKPKPVPVPVKVVSKKKNTSDSDDSSNNEDSDIELEVEIPRKRLLR
jgi:hypothetical protein